MGRGIEVVQDCEPCVVRRPRPGILIRNLRRWPHRYSRGREECSSGTLPESGVVHCGQIHEEVHLRGWVFLKKPRHFEQELSTQNHGGVARYAWDAKAASGNWSVTDLIKNESLMSRGSPDEIRARPACPWCAGSESYLGASSDRPEPSLAAVGIRGCKHPPA